MAQGKSHYWRSGCSTCQCHCILLLLRASLSLAVSTFSDHGLGRVLTLQFRDDLVFWDVTPCRQVNVFTDFLEERATCVFRIWQSNLDVDRTLLRNVGNYWTYTPPLQPTWPEFSEDLALHRSSYEVSRAAGVRTSELRRAILRLIVVFLNQFRLYCDSTVCSKSNCSAHENRIHAIPQMRAFEYQVVIMRSIVEPVSRNTWFWNVHTELFINLFCVSNWLRLLPSTPLPLTALKTKWTTRSKS
jgi:hypothetical protein